MVPDGDIARDLGRSFLAIDDVAGAWKAYRKVGGKYRKESALDALLAWSGTHDDPSTALEALERHVKERPDDLNPLRRGVDAFEASRAARGVRVMVGVF